MPLNQQDKQDIKEMLDSALKEHTVPVGRVSFSSGQVVAIVMAILCAAISVGGAIVGVRGDLNDVKVEVAPLSTKLDERLPLKQSPIAPSTDTRSSTPPFCG